MKATFITRLKPDLIIDIHLLRLLQLLIITDCMFIFLHMINCHTCLISEPMLILATDGGYSELFQYIKMFWVFLLMGYIAIRFRAWLYGFWSVLFAYLLIDDSTRIHETVGGHFIGSRLPQWGILNSIDAYDLGQVVFAGLIGVVLFSVLLIFYYFSNEFVRKTSRYLFYLLCVFVFFAVGIDVLGVLLNVKGASILEETGELVVMSTVLWYVFTLHMHVLKKGQNFV